MLLAGGGEHPGAGTRDARGLCKASRGGAAGARVRQSQHRLLTQLSTSRTMRSVDAPSSFFPAQTKLVHLLLSLWMGCPPQDTAKQLRLMLHLTKGSMKMAEEPSLPPEHPCSSQRKSLCWPHSPAYMKPTLLSKWDPIPSGSVPTMGTTSPWSSEAVEGTVTLEKVSPACIAPGDKQRGQDQKLSAVQPWFCCQHTQSDGAATTTVTLSPLCTSPSCRQHPHHTGCHGRARSRLAW